jgi:hypothetical protein
MPDVMERIEQVCTWILRARKFERRLTGRAYSLPPSPRRIASPVWPDLISDRHTRGRPARGHSLKARIQPINIGHVIPQSLSRRLVWLSVKGSHKRPRNGSQGTFHPMDVSTRNRPAVVRPEGAFPDLVPSIACLNVNQFTRLVQFLTLREINQSHFSGPTADIAGGPVRAHKRIFARIMGSLGVDSQADKRKRRRRCRSLPPNFAGFPFVWNAPR